MSDLVGRLRARDWSGDADAINEVVDDLTWEAADEIERLLAEVARFVPMFSATKNNLYAGPPHSKLEDPKGGDRT